MFTRKDNNDNKLIIICRIFELTYDTHTTEPAKENGLAPCHLPEVTPMYDHHTYQFKSE